MSDGKLGNSAQGSKLVSLGSTREPSRAARVVFQTSRAEASLFFSKRAEPTPISVFYVCNLINFLLIFAVKYACRGD